MRNRLPHRGPWTPDQVFADLHLHSSCSDGTWTPEELVHQARLCDFRVVALTDHDTVKGCERMEAACRLCGIEFIHGTEMTASFEGEETHLLGYFIDPRHAGLLAALRELQDGRRERVREMTARLNQLNIALSAEDVFVLADCQSPGRPHVARALVTGGYCGSYNEAFERFLKKHRPAWVPKRRASAAEAIALIHAAGGLASMAHPAVSRMDHLIPGLKAVGLDALECFHTKHPASTVEHYLELARQLELLVTGGSDCHGEGRGRPVMGTVRFPCAYMEPLRAAARARQSEARPTRTHLVDTARAVGEPA